MESEDKELIVLEGLEGNKPTELYGLQEFLAPHYTLLESFWWAVFFVTVCVVTYRLIEAFYDEQS